MSESRGVGAGPPRGLVEKARVALASAVTFGWWPLDERGQKLVDDATQVVLSAVWPALVEEAREGVREEITQLIKSAERAITALERISALLPRDRQPTQGDINRIRLVLAALAGSDTTPGGRER